MSWCTQLILVALPLAWCVNVPNPQNPDHNVRESWGYTPANGPATWPGTFSTCGGQSQSPIDIKTASATVANPGAISTVGYTEAMKGNITNNEHTITFTYTSGIKPYIMGGRLPAGDRYEFLQLHWHWGSVSTRGSEHTMDGKEYPAELHLVHWNTKYGDVGTAVTKSDGLAVLGFFYEVSTADNGNLDAMLGVVDQVRRKQRKVNIKSKMGRAGASSSVEVPATIRLDQLLPSTGLPDEYYYYMGSLTTPTCDEVVQWTVFSQTVPISEKQLEKFRTLKDSNGVTLNDNYRPPQPLNGRTVYKRSVMTPAEPNAAAVGAAVGGAAVGSLATLFAIGVLQFLAPQTSSSRRSQGRSLNRGVSQREEEVLRNLYHY